MNTNTRYVCVILIYYVSLNYNQNGAKERGCINEERAWSYNTLGINIIVITINNKCIKIKKNDHNFSKSFLSSLTPLIGVKSMFNLAHFDSE